MNALFVTRWERRALRRQRFAEDREARQVARLAGLDYRVSGESGALVVHTHSLSWHRSKSPNITVPPSGRSWGRSGSVYMIETQGTGRCNVPQIPNLKPKQEAEAGQ